MYTPSSFKETNPEVLFDLIEKYNFGILFSQHHEQPEATHLPFLVHRSEGEKGLLIAHLAKANKHWKKLNSEEEVLCVFQGPHTYISPSWYENRETVPTWNYATVHVYGKPKVIHELEDLKKMVTRLTHYHESQVDTDWSLDEGKSSFKKNLLGIVGLEIDITRIEGKFKFNQNRSKADQQGVVKNLENSTSTEVVDIMKKNLNE